ncbi:diflavin oxidoreductase [Mycobacterium vicinigordonae]|uniref:assimilatory sulfite reductase (NADPH) n=1 Tax=Mycobacterium vicinigordonae TaxID=1719132 RepID=A0A7D6I140_9MYCO|nr:sulfite reductase flavoprotein subunit alpha [Mycobacterium vicinigordonae]QLL07614.1 sulfite reductase flavoprotein subunit alpha [Mycobacterium vicinigordonae]
MAAEFAIVIAYGSDMGNAEDAALSFAEALDEAVSTGVTAIELNQVDPADLQSVTHLVVVTSTFGDGEFPDNATLFWEAISADDADRVEHLKFAVLALGDSGYDLFCNAGRLLDERLETLGAMRLADRVDIDGPYEQPAAAWIADLVKVLAAERAGTVPTESNPPPAEAVEPTQRDRSHRPVGVRVLVNRVLTAPESDKEVRHYELDLAASGIAYTAGDSLAVHATNDPALVDAILGALGVGPDYTVHDGDEPLGALLSGQLEIRTPSRALRALVAARVPNAEAAVPLGADTVPAPGSWWYGKDVLDLIRLGSLTVEDVLDTLRPLQFRDYSIASSPLVHPDHIHLTVATVRYDIADRRYGGVASTFLADRSGEVQVHLLPNHTFRLPAGDVPIIMIGPGTGIAPFRAFLQERQACGAKGRSWLFFGDRRRATSFLYGDEIEGFRDSGTLTRLDLAFSRDGAADESKPYVQHRMWDNADEFFGWMQDGAHIYVCGDAERMAKDVDAAIHGIVAQSGNLDPDAAHAYVNQLIRDHRYLRDVY